MTTERHLAVFRDPHKIVTLIHRRQNVIVKHLLRPVVRLWSSFGDSHHMNRPLPLCCRYFIPPAAKRKKTHPQGEKTAAAVSTAALSHDTKHFFNPSFFFAACSLPI
jgi:hypothetical protein